MHLHHEQTNSQTAVEAGAHIIMDYPAILTLFTTLAGLSAGLLAISRSLDNRFNRLSQKVSELDQRLSLGLEKYARDADNMGARELSHWDMAEYRINANTELINHRTKRFQDAIAALETRLTQNIRDIEAFLDKTTEFTIRGRHEDLPD